LFLRVEDGVAAVVELEAILQIGRRIEAGFKLAGRCVSQIKRRADDVALGNRHLGGVAQLAVEEELHCARLRRLAEVGDLDERLALFGAAVVAARVERRDREVVRFYRADGKILGVEIAERETLDRAEAAVAEDIELDRLLLGGVDLGASLFDRDPLGIGEAIGQGQRIADVGWLGRRLDAVERFSKQAAIVSELLDHVRVVVVGDDHRRHIGIHLVDEGGDLLLGRIEPGGVAFAVGGRHAGGAIDQEDELLTAERLALPPWTEEGEDREGDQQELEEQQQVLAKPLPDAVHVEVFDDLRPEIGAGNFERLALELQKVERKDRRRDKPDGDPSGGAERVAE
jgi:hypothetical protein